MSSLIVEVCKVDDVVPHPNADKLEIARIKGWETCVPKGAYRPGSLCVYIPPESVLPVALSDRLGITKYLQPVKSGGELVGGRVRVSRLRGFRSYGTIMPPDEGFEVGEDVAAKLGITKYEPPLECTDGDAEAPHPAFHRYYDMENLRHFPDAIPPGTPVIVTEKIHGQNCRLGLIRDVDENGVAVWRWMAGSHEVRRKRFSMKGGKEVESVFWQCLTPEVQVFLSEESHCGYSPKELWDSPPVKGLRENRDIVLFGERYGSGVQDMQYGMDGGKFQFRAFDYTINGQFQGCLLKVLALNCCDVEMAPILWEGGYDFNKICELASGPTTLADVKSGFGGREGVVVTTRLEMTLDTPRKFMSRAQFKCISFDYLERKNGTEGH